MKLSLLICVLSLTLFTQSTFAAPVKQKALERKKWTLTESPNFRIVSDAKPRQIILIVEQLERFRAFSYLLLGVPAERAMNPSLLIITKSRGTWRALGLDKRYVSFTQSSVNGDASIFAHIDGFIGSSLEESNPSRATVFNALAFKLLYDANLNERVPFWYFRAFSHYLAGYTEQDDSFRIGEITSMGLRLRALFHQSGHFMPIDVVSLMSRASYKNSLTGQELSERQRAKFSAQAYIMVHYFYADHKRKQQLSDFIATMKSGESIEKRLLDAFGESPEQLSDKISKYARASLSVPNYNRKLVESRLSLPDTASFSQGQMSVSEFWQTIYPVLAKLPDDMISFDEKKTLRNAVKEHLPTVNHGLRILSHKALTRCIICSMLRLVKEPAKVDRFISKAIRSWALYSGDK